MPMYHASLLEIDPGETRRYAGLGRAEDFDGSLIGNACGDALLLSAPKGIWQDYGYDCQLQEVLADPPCRILGEKAGRHLSGCHRVIFLAATVGEGIEEEVTARFKRGEYASSLLLDAAATAAVEQVADAMERAIRPWASGRGYRMRWRFSPGYGDWPLEQQGEVLRLSHGRDIGISLSESLMLIPRKSITAVIGLWREDIAEKTPSTEGHPRGCEGCSKKDCPSRKA